MLRQSQAPKSYPKAKSDDFLKWRIYNLGVPLRYFFVENIEVRSLGRAQHQEEKHET